MSKGDGVKKKGSKSYKGLAGLRPSLYKRAEIHVETLKICSSLHKKKFPV